MKPIKGLYQPKGSPYWWIQYFDHGKRFRESTKETNAKRAERLLNLRKGQIASHTFIPPEVERVTLGQLAEDLFTEYTANGSKSLNTVKKFRWEAHLKDTFAHRRAISITRDDLMRYATSRQAEQASNATINRELSALRKMFSLAVASGKVRTAPKFPHLSENNVRTGFVTADQYTALAAACAQDSLWLRGMTEVAYTYGWRRSELTEMRVRQVNLLEGTIRLDVGTTKNKEGREVGMTQAVRTLLTACISGKGPDDRVFTHEDGSKIGDFRKRWENVCTTAGVPGLLFHDLRRSGVRNLVRAGVSEHVAMSISGHKTRSTFDRYDIISDRDRQDAVRKLENSHNIAIIEPATVRPQASKEAN